MRPFAGRRRGRLTTAIAALLALGCSTFGARRAPACPTLARASEVRFACAVTTPARLLDAPPPTYPWMLRDANYEGSVRLRFVVRADGTVDTSSITELGGFHAQRGAGRSTVPHDLVWISARRAVAKWRFSPARLGRRAVAQYRVEEFLFRLTPDPDSSLASACRATPTTLDRLCIPAASPEVVYGAVRGVFRDAAGGTPIPGAVVWSADSAGRAFDGEVRPKSSRTDSAGRFLIPAAPRGIVRLVGDCYNRLSPYERRVPGPLVTVVRADTVDAEFVAPAGTCLAPKEDTVPGVFRGRLSVGFELLHFDARGQRSAGFDFAGPGREASWKRVERAYRDCDKASWPFSTVDLVVRGRRVGPRGNMGDTVYVVLADSLLSARRPPSSACRDD